MKERLAKLQELPISGFQSLRNPAEAKRLSVEFPVVVKPIDCGGSKGVRKAVDRQELWLAAQGAFKVTRAGEILIEEFCEGVEVAADCFVQGGEPHILLLRKKHMQSAGMEAVLANYASVSPAAISAAARKTSDRATQEHRPGLWAADDPATHPVHRQRGRRRADRVRPAGWRWNQLPHSFC